jgi:RHS repeat-associated protein
MRTWDNNGNLLSDGASTYTYTSNKLSSISGENLNVTFQYNGLGDRLSQTVNGVTTNYTLDLNAGLTQVLSDGTNTYLYGMDRIAQVNGSVTEYFLTDALGSVRQLADNTGAVTLAKSYQPYGTPLTATGSGASIYGFTGEQQDPTGLTYLRARYYSSAQGRFLTRDTWGGDTNRPMSYNRWNYGYGNPVKYTDPAGLSPLALFRKGNPKGEDASNAPEWTQLEMQAIDIATSKVANAYAKAYNEEMKKRKAICEGEPAIGYYWLPNKISPSTAFLAIHGGPINFWRMSLTSQEYLNNDSANWFAMEKDPRNIYLFKNYTESNLGGDLNRKTRLYIHEIGHAFDEVIEKKRSIRASSSLESQYLNHDGFAGDFEYWMFHTQENSIEFFADMFIGWTYQKWDETNGLLTDPALKRSDFMNSRMPNWIVSVIGDWDSR